RGRIKRIGPGAGRDPSFNRRAFGSMGPGLRRDLVMAAAWISLAAPLNSSVMAGLIRPSTTPSASVAFVGDRVDPGHDGLMWKRYGFQLRYCRPAKCREIGAVQRADRDAGGRDDEVCVLDGRAECRAGSRTGF